MSGGNEEVMALADVYAESLLGAAAQRGQEDAVAAEFAELIAYMDREPDFDAFLTAESVDDDPRRVSLEKLFRGRMNDLLLNLLQVLNNRRRCGLIRTVQRCVVLRMEARHHQQEVVVQTAMPLSDELREVIRNQISERIGKKAILIEEVRPELLGGVVIRVGDLQIDGSVASHIRAMQSRLFDRATEEIRGGPGHAAEA